MSDKNYLMTIYEGLNESLERQIQALPKDFNRQRFVQNCMTMLQDGKADFSKCDARTVVRTLMKASYLGLDFFNGECYAIPYGNTCQFQTDYKGEIKLVKKYSKNPIRDIYAKLVREGDEFQESIENGVQTICFKPQSFSNKPVIGAFAVVYFKDGSMIYETMSAEEIEKTRQTYSKAANSKAWKESTGEMQKKTVLRRICKLIDLDFDNIEQVKAFEDGGDMDLEKEPEKADNEKVVDVFDADFTEVEGGDELNVEA